MRRKQNYSVVSCITAVEEPNSVNSPNQCPSRYGSERGSKVKLQMQIPQLGYCFFYLQTFCLTDLHRGLCNLPLTCATLADRAGPQTALGNSTRSLDASGTAVAPSQQASTPYQRTGAVHGEQDWVKSVQYSPSWCLV